MSYLMDDKIDDENSIPNGSSLLQKYMSEDMRSELDELESDPAKIINHIND